MVRLEKHLEALKIGLADRLSEERHQGNLLGF